ncbi:MAG: lasso peptide biosynthesis PqqD family chaperone [Bacillota bacterium]|nr:lasso peptide biosynthesis PqqD family chaperone [Bacillota bacterium]
MEAVVLNSVIAGKKEITTAEMDGEVVMMSLETGKYYNLGNMGTVIWRMIDNPVSVETIIRVLLEKYDVTREQCEAEVLAFLNAMSREGLLDIQ